MGVIQVEKSSVVKKLAELGFLEEHVEDGKVMCALATPVNIRFSKEVAHELTANYHLEHEIGGVLLGVPLFEDGKRVLEIRKVAFLRNLSKTPKLKFEFKKSDIARVWNEDTQTDHLLYIPIHFHSHPLLDTHPSNWMTLFYSLSPVLTSGKDQKTASELHVELNGLNFHVPCAFLVRSRLIGEEIIVGFYGGRVIPTDFTEYMTKLTGKTMKDVWGILKREIQKVEEWVSKDPTRELLLIVGIIVGLIVTGYIAVKFRRAMPIIAILVILLVASQVVPIAKQAEEIVPRYFGILKEDLVVHIPSSKPE